MSATSVLLSGATEATSISWDTFIPDLIVAVVGAVLTVAIAVVTYTISRRNREVQALRSLITDLHHRRALSIGSPQVSPRARELADFRYSSRSVKAIRDEIKRARDAVRPHPDVQEPLTTMTRACNTYLEESAWDPTRYHFLLEDLRDRLAVGVRDTSAQYRKLPYLEPGAGSF